MSARNHLAVGHDQLYSGGELLLGNVREVLAHLLVGGVIDPIPGYLLPIFDPGATEGTIAVEDEKRAVWRRFGHPTWLRKFSLALTGSLQEQLALARIAG